MSITLATITCKIAPNLPAAYEYCSTLNSPASIVPTTQGYVIVENALEYSRTRRTTEKEVKRVRANAKQIYCPETGKTYMSLREAAADTGAAYQNISKVLHNRAEKTAGFHFKYMSEMDEIITNGDEEY